MSEPWTSPPMSAGARDVKLILEHLRRWEDDHANSGRRATSMSDWEIMRVAPCIVEALKASKAAAHGS